MNTTKERAKQCNQDIFHTNDTLPFPSSLCRLGLIEVPNCKLCGEKRTMAHILSICKTALQQGRYNWRQESFTTFFRTECRKKRQQKYLSRSIQFIRARDKKQISSSQVGLLNGPCDWQPLLTCKPVETSEDGCNRLKSKHMGTVEIYQMKLES